MPELKLLSTTFYETLCTVTSTVSSIQSSQEYSKLVLIKDLNGFTVCQTASETVHETAEKPHGNLIFHSIPGE